MATVVLVHGNTAGGWVWKTIAPRLRAAGHVVYTPTLTGLGERVHLAHRGVDLDTHIADITNVLEFEELDEVVLVGHSYAGMVITGVADRMPQHVARLVYLDALVPRDGDTAIDLLGPEGGPSIRRQVETEGDGWRIPVQRGANDRPTHNVPHPFKTFAQPLRLGTAAAAIPLRLHSLHGGQTAWPGLRSRARNILATRSGGRLAHRRSGHDAPDYGSGPLPQSDGTA